MRASVSISSRLLRPQQYTISAPSMQCPVRLHGEYCPRTALCVGCASHPPEGLRFVHYDCGEHRVHVSVPPGLWWDDCDC
jgi:hypothetical protein